MARRAQAGIGTVQFLPGGTAVICARGTDDRALYARKSEGSGQGRVGNQAK